MPNKLINCEQLAARLGVAGRTIRLWSAKGWIPSFKVGTVYRYDYTEVLAALHHPATKEATPHVEIRPGQTTIGATQLELPATEAVQ